MIISSRRRHLANVCPLAKPLYDEWIQVVLVLWEGGKKNPVNMAYRTEEGVKDKIKPLPSSITMSKQLVGMNGCDEFNPRWQSQRY